MLIFMVLRVPSGVVMGCMRMCEVLAQMGGKNKQWLTPKHWFESCGCSVSWCHYWMLKMMFDCPPWNSSPVLFLVNLFLTILSESREYQHFKFCCAVVAQLLKSCSQYLGTYIYRCLSDPLWLKTTPAIQSQTACLRILRKSLLS